MNEQKTLLSHAQIEELISKKSGTVYSGAK